MTMPVAERRLTTPAIAGPVRAVDRAVAAAADVLARHSIAALRISLGLMFLGFGALKFFPGASPAEELVKATLHELTLGIVHGRGAMVLTAVVECLIGVTLVTGRLLGVGLALLAGAMVGILSPLVLFFGELFPGGRPTIEGQYVLKDIVVVTAAAVVTARVLGARFVTDPDR